MKRTLTACLALVFLLAGISTASAKEYKMLIMNFTGKAEVKAFDPLVEYLSEAIGVKVVATGIKPSGITKRAESCDMVLSNPVVSLKIVDSYGYEIIATQSHKQLGPKFAGVIIVKRDSPIQSLQDLAGKKVGVVHLKNAAGGFLFQAKELLNAGLVPERDFTNFVELQNQKAIVMHVGRGTMDAGFIRTGLLEKFAKKGIVNSDDYRILNEITEGLAFPRSTTAIYPHWGFSVNTNTVSIGDKAKIEAALLALDAGSVVSQTANIRGFVPAGGYDELKSVMKELKVYDFKH